MAHFFGGIAAGCKGVQSHTNSNSHKQWGNWWLVFVDACASESLLMLYNVVVVVVVTV